MKHATTLHSSYAMLFDPAAARAAAERAERWNLPRHICRPLDRYAGSWVNLDLAAFDAAVDSAPVADEEMQEDLHCAAVSESATPDPDFDGEDDF